MYHLSVDLNVTKQTHTHKHTHLHIYTDTILTSLYEKLSQLS